MHFHLFFLGECNVHLPKQLQAQALHGLQPLGGGITPFPIIYFVTLHGGYIQMTFLLDYQVGVPKLGLLLFILNMQQ
jgi:hypothetical protein